MGIVNKKIDGTIPLVKQTSEGRLETTERY